MAKKVVKVVEEEAAPSEVTPAPHAAEMVTVKFVGKERAVLAGRLILAGETRIVSRAMFEAVSKARPGEFVDVNAPVVVEKNETPQPQG